jgi:spore coat protein H
MKRIRNSKMCLEQVKKVALLLVFSLLITSCYKEEIISEEESIEEEVIPGTGLADWTNETHSNEVAPNYSLVFPQDIVNRVDLVISASNWSRMLQDLSSNLVNTRPGDNSISSYTPIFVPASVFFNGTEWYNVGIRFKGNSSLRTAYQSRIMKLSFRFDFDEFEDTYPEIKDQRFYGFHKLAFSNNFEDVSFLHEKLAADIFRDAGLKAPQTAYYRIYVDYGEGAKYFGLYTAVEIVEDTMLGSQFGNNSGNCYKPDGTNLKSFSISTMEKKTNEDIADYSDVRNLITILNASTRTSDIAQWKSDLESVFDVDNFMKWLAVNTVIQNWDTYGRMTHNFYLYNDPATSKLVWIPWDNNEALSAGKQTALSPAMSEVTSSWPLIRYLIDVPAYKTMYDNYLSQTINGAFNPADIKEKYQYYHNLIQPYVTGAEGEVSGYTFLRSSSEFVNALTTQMNHVDTRFNVTSSYLSTQ